MYWFDMQTETQGGRTDIGCVGEQGSWETARKREGERERGGERERDVAGENKSHVQGIIAFTLHLWLRASENQKEWDGCHMQPGVEWCHM